MLIFYENTILNKLIVSSIFDEIQDDNIISFERLFENINIDDSETEVMIICSSSVQKDEIEKYMNESRHTCNFTFILKDIEESVHDNYIISNWYIYWTNAYNALMNQNIEDELIKNIFHYYQQYPSISQRRIIEYLNFHLSLPNKRFIEILSNETASMIQHKGRNVIEQKQNEINKDKNNSLIKTLNKVRYAFCVSNFIETAFQLIDNLHVSVVVLFELNLKNSFVNVKIITKDNQTHIFSNRSHLKNGSLSVLRITFQEFIDVINSY